ncbi:MAG: hypothetical protein U9R75_08405 [Candidatus Thermoplasmatota archaeon]|nr:hypothetical protein [Candidatus Thermoplasmatota archaeon]
MEIPMLFWILCVALPLITGVVMSFIIWASYQKGLDEYRMERKDIDDIAKKKRRYVMLFMLTAIVPAFYGIVLIWILSVTGNVAEPYQEKAVNMAGWVAGVPIVISLISQGVLISYFMKDYLKEEEPDFNEIYKQGSYRRSSYNRRRYPFSSSLVIFIIPQTIATLGLIVAILLLTFSSILDGSTGDDLNQTADQGYGDGGFLIDEENIDAVETGSWIFTGLSSLSLLSAVLPMFVKGSIMEKRVFKWRIILGVAGTLPSVIGLLIWILMMT